MAARAAEIGLHFELKKAFYEQHYMVTLWTLEFSSYWCILVWKIEFQRHVTMYICLIYFEIYMRGLLLYQIEPPRPLNVSTASTFRIFSRLSIKIASDPLFNLLYRLKYKLSTF